MCIFPGSHGGFEQQAIGPTYVPRTKALMEPMSGQSHFRVVRRLTMREDKTGQYTVEQLQQEYAVSLAKAVEVLDRYGGDRAIIEKLLKRCPHRNDEADH
ncbi:hypothetical protein BS628_18260 [Agrobacterium radiobacter]|nr:hypothetical protein ASH09_18435 [Agrobacterium radiobacter]OOO33031.1 hypothetical protein BS628_18260 [Agrobacterium radiobacter]